MTNATTKDSVNPIWSLTSGLATKAAEVAKIPILKLLKSIQIGTITIIDNTASSSESSSKIHQFGNLKETKLKSTLTIHSPKAWLRIAAFDALGFGESYMYHELDIQNLPEFIEIIILNRPYIPTPQPLPLNINTHLKNLLNSKVTNSLLNSLTNISKHYDLGNEMFAAFLSKEMMYSCPVWKPVPVGANAKSNESLEDAQMTKIRMIIDKAGLKKGDRVLEIGTGWGAFAIEAVKRTGCTVDTITLSKEQAYLANERIASAGLSDSITVHLMDYRHLPLQFRDRKFDKVVSIEMLEAVGPEYLSTYFEVVDQILHPEHGVGVFQVITMPESRYEAYCRKIDFINKHIFPGGHCPSTTALIDAILQGSKGKLILNHLENIGGHYARALRIWREKFLSEFDKFKNVKPDVYTDEFKRKWEWYFAYCEGGFAQGVLGDIQMVLTRKGYGAGGNTGVPR